MNRTVEKGKTLLVNGPASVTVVSGKAEVFGTVISSASKVVIREGKQLPLAVEETTTFDLSLAEKASAEEVDGNTIPASWAASFEKVSELQAKPVIIMVLGTMDSGKTSFCTYLVNKLLGQKKKVAVLDGDLGQSDIGPPCTVAYALPSKPITDPFNLRARNAVFIGVTSPESAVDKVIEGLTTLKQEALNSNPDAIITNTDGWIEGEGALKYKTRLAEAIKPDIIFCIQQKDELAQLMEGLKEFKTIMVSSPSVINQRDKEKRKSLRELGYIKYLRNAKIQSFPQGWLKIEDNELFGLGRANMNFKETRKIYELLGMKPLHIVERVEAISIIIGKRRWVNAENLKKIEEAAKKKVHLIRKGDEEGLLVALFNSDRKFLGIGVLQEIEYLRKTIKILTPVSEGIAITTIGKVKLDRNMKEIPALGEENQSDNTTLSRLF